MKVGVIGAMEEEVNLLREEIESPKTKIIANCEFVEGVLGKHEVVLVKSGIGKVNAAIATTLLLETYKPDVVINTGSAGGFLETLEIGSIVISDEVCHHDVDVTAFGYAHGQVPNLPETFKAESTLIQSAKEAVDEIGQHTSAVGLVASSDSFMSDTNRVEQVRQIFPSMIAAEMEAAAVAQVCHQFGTPFVVIRALSDIAGKESSISFDEFLPVAARHSTDIVLRVISKL
ncbi:5'-methylthioadenosine/S-adenosylhomocysteine nucleosidase [Sporosarcina pasteurii]|uniref:5'-methylthioadenosine/S-adenosylhomocysteine nucleosidase n=1 Tax=Sporosarcina pasteurii TaxID=1474 RepID=A0A380BNG7_SPOPA|nr:5'-methylthioadenosine/S-adenosylhomocysteine nucleosidase [Sporosarcina pasteurii]MDS9470992.1 5'-methylthioadenosine/S-adenosylhomocysteine nucleosidase [Sporosarcina pasteurii]QBQ05358.1 5'-methylthioadenosine/S-adenosylhomocysteine nucleosidase [Sporosarcina pasteurii]SUJ03784.1 5'-methylthioadenosine/S-adenosylhomocysteine nucleosidase [Sporosarcina pasteurii]